MGDREWQEGDREGLGQVFHYDFREGWGLG